MAFNPDEPRDERGRWTGSGVSAPGSGWRDKSLFDRSRAGRGSALAMHANLSMTDTFRRRPRWADPEPGERLGRLLPRWNAASRLDDDTFRDRYLGRGVSLETVRALRTAARLAAGARTSGEMAQAGECHPGNRGRGLAGVPARRRSHGRGGAGDHRGGRPG
jgi:hypothetical protein